MIHRLILHRNIYSFWKSWEGINLSSYASFSFIDGFSKCVALRFSLWKECFLKITILVILRNHEWIWIPRSRNHLIKLQTHVYFRKISFLGVENQTDIFSVIWYDNLSAAVICFLSPLIKYKALINYRQVLITTYCYVVIGTTK
jgi:hypothetical protein